MTAPRRILWLGAHKTGTTFLQACLDASAETLARHSIDYLDLDTFRERYTRPLLDPNYEEPAATNTFDPAHRQLVFDENIPGLVQHVLGSRGMYPKLIRRIKIVNEHLGFEPDSIVFGVRSYATFLPSLYNEVLKATPFVTWSRFVDRSFRPRGRGPVVFPSEYQYGRLDWHDVLTRLKEAFPAASVAYYRAEELRGRELQLLGTVLGVPADELTLADHGGRTGFSLEAVRRMHLHHLNSDVGVRHPDVRRFNEEFPTSDRRRRFSPLSEHERAGWDVRYAVDLNAMAADDDLVTIELG